MRNLCKQPGRLFGVLALGLGLTLQAFQAQAVRDIPGIDQSDGTANAASFQLYAFPCPRAPASICGASGT